jgi:hypothetical protein
VAGEQSQQQYSLSPDHYGPAGGAVGSGKRFKDLEPRRQVDLQSTVAARNKHSEASRGHQIAQQIARQFTGGFNFSGARSD